MSASGRTRRRPPTRGTDAWKEYGGTSFCHWDRWYLAVLVGDCEGSWAELEAPFRERLDEAWSGFRREDAESKLCHGEDLRDRLERSAVEAGRLLDADRDDRALLRKARKKLYEQMAMDGYATEAMRRTPRRVLSERARRGNWADFPVSPGRFEAELMEHVEAKRHFPVSSTVALVRRLEEAYDRLLEEHQGDPDATLAVRRAFLTTLVEALDRSDDSYGELGRALQGRIAAHCAAGPDGAAVPFEPYHRDLLEFCIWEHYGCRGDGLRHGFARIEDGDVGPVEEILTALRSELLDARLDYEAEEALTILGELHVTRGSLDRFVGLATEMGSRAWERITTMAEAAMEAGDRALAVQVFQAANQPGSHRDYLARRCRELTGHELREPRHLELVR